MDGEALVPLVCRALWNRPCRAPWTPLCSWPGWSPPCRCGPSRTADIQTPGSWGTTRFLRRWRAGGVTLTLWIVIVCRFVYYLNLWRGFDVNSIITQRRRWQHFNWKNTFSRIFFGKTHRKDSLWGFINAPYIYKEWEKNQPLCSRSYNLCCQKLLNGAMPVPGPTRIQGAWLSLGRWNDGALKQCNRQKKWRQSLWNSRQT